MADKENSLSVPADQAGADEAQNNNSNDTGGEKLAGKFENTAELEKAYKELEKKLGANDQEEDSGAADGVDADDPSVKAEAEAEALKLARDMLKATGEDSLNPEQKKLIEKHGAEETSDDQEDGDEGNDEDEGNGSDKPEHAHLPKGTDFDTYDMLKGQGLDADAMIKELQAGTLSDDSYKALDEAGFTKTAVDNYIRGLNADTSNIAGDASEEGSEPSEAEVALAKQEVAEIKSIAGGDEGYAAMSEWAKQELSKDDLTAFNTAVESGNKHTAAMAVRSLYSQYTAAEGADPTATRLGGGRASQDVYSDVNEVKKDMGDEKYESSEKFRQYVADKLMRSNVNF